MWCLVITCFIVLAIHCQNVEAQYNHGYRPTFLSENKPYVFHTNEGIPVRAPIVPRIYKDQRIPREEADKVRVDVYYETNCPDSMKFINYQLYYMYQDLKDIVDIHLVPFGKATEKYDPDTKKYKFRCHHGPAECYGNTVQSCAMSLYPRTEEYLEFINCMEAYPRPSDSGQRCARRLSMDWKSISKCADGEEGNRLLHEKAQLTNSLNPPLHFVPWITINKVYSDAIQAQSLRNLKRVVCETYKGNHSKC